MKLLKTLVLTVLVGSALAAQAETRVIEGQGAAKNRAGVAARFAIRVGQVNSDPAQGRLEMSWMQGDAKVSIVCEHPNAVMVREHEGRFEGQAVVTVTRGHDSRHWGGTVRFTGVDLRDANHRDQKDKLRVRFIRNPWEAPEGDFFFEGEVSDGDLSVKKT